MLSVVENFNFCLFYHIVPAEIVNNLKRAYCFKIPYLPLPYFLSRNLVLLNN